MAASATKDEILVRSREGRDTWAIFRFDPLKNERGAMLFGHPTEDVTAGEDLRGEAPRSYVTQGLKPVRH